MRSPEDLFTPVTNIVSIGPDSQLGGMMLRKSPPNTQSMMSANTIEIPIVTSVWRKSCRSILRKTKTCRRIPSSPTRMNATGNASSQYPVQPATM